MFSFSFGISKSYVLQTALEWLSFRNTSLFAATACCTAAGLCAEPLQFEELGVEDGLSQTVITAIAQDSLGFMWFGTQEGLNRYDGRNIKIYLADPLDTAKLPGSAISALVATPNGDLWIGTEKGLARWLHRSDTFQRVSLTTRQQQELNDLDIRTLHLDSSHTLWIGTESDGLFRYNIQQDITQSIPLRLVHGEQLNSQVLALWRDGQERLWIGLRDGLALLDPEALTMIPRYVEPNIKVFSLAVTADGLLSVGTAKGLFHYDDAENHWMSTPRGQAAEGNELGDPLSNNGITAVRAQHIDDQGHWFGTDDGIQWVDPALNRSLSRAGPHRALQGKRITSIYRDAGEVLWLGSVSGLFRHHAPLLPKVSHEPTTLGSLSKHPVWSFSQGPDRRLWVGTYEGGLQYQDPGTQTFHTLLHDPTDATSLPDNRISALLHDAQGVLWVGTMESGLCRIRTRLRFECFGNQPGDLSSLSSNRVGTLFKDASGTLWIGTMGGGLNRWTGRGTFERYITEDEGSGGPPDQRVATLAETNPRWLWFGTLDHGLYRWDRDRGVSQQFLPEADGTGLSHSSVSSLLYDDVQDVLWVGTLAGGLNRLTQPNDDPVPDNWTTLALPNEVSQTVNGLLMDSNRLLWISTNRGLLRFDPATETFLSFDTSHGLQDLDFYLGAHFAADDGTLYFGGPAGFNIIHPGDLQLHAHPPKVVLTDVLTFDSPLPLKHPAYRLESLLLDHRDQFLKFEVAALAYAAQEKKRYRYRLLGSFDGWIPMGRDHSISFNQLEPGSYTLEVQATDGAGDWSPHGLRLDMRMRPPWWLSSTASAAYAILLGLLAWTYVSRQERKVQQAEAISQQLMDVDRLKDEFLANTSHELRTPLHGITGLAESLLQNHGTGLSTMAMESLEMIVSSGRRLSGLVDDILDFQRLRHAGLQMELRPTHLRPLVQLCLRLTHPLVGNKPIELVDQVPLGLAPVLADENRVKQVLLNLLGNAIKFTHRGSVRVTARERDSTLEIEVADTGIGIAKNQLASIFEPFEQADTSTVRTYQGTGLGLTISHELIRNMGGRLWVESRLGQGSSFFFSLPKADAPSPSPETESRESFRHLSKDIAALRQASQPLPSASMSQSEPQEEGSRILVVDDERVNRQVLRNYLAQENHGVTFVDHGEAALQVVVEHTFDLVLLDVMMPQMSGYEVCRILRTEFSLEQLPVIFLTAKGQEADILEGLDAGANDYLTKPISRGELLSRIRPHLRLVRLYRQLGASVETKSHQLRILHGLLPICAQCKKIRDEGNQWENLESYLDRHSEAEFSHSICPDCAQDLYPEYVNR